MLTRVEWQCTADVRVRDAEALLKARRWSAAYYLAGYAVECGLKACVVVYVKRNADLVFREKKYMYREPLVIEQIEAGRKFIDELDQYVPVRAAFWLKASEDSGWYRYVASEQVTAQKIRAAYGEVARASRNIQDPNFALFRVKVLGIGDPLAKAALDVYRRFSRRVPTRVRAGEFGTLGAEGVYLYPPPAATART